MNRHGEDTAGEAAAQKLLDDALQKIEYWKGEGNKILPGLYKG